MYKNIIKNYIYIIVTISLLILFACCNNKKDNNTEKKFDASKYKNPLIKANKHLVRTEDEEIENFIKRYKWNINETGTGLRYMIYKKGNGSKAQKGEIAKINYRVNLINGELCYSSEKEGTREFLIGKGGVESGLEEGILLLKVGDKAKFIIPSHRAFGLLGDQNKIPKRATLIYDIELLELKN